MVRRFVLAAALGSVGLLVMITLMSSTGPDRGTFLPLLEPGADSSAHETGDEAHVSMLDGPAPTAALLHSPRGDAIIVLKVAGDDLARAADATGQPTGRWAIEHPTEPGMRILAYHGHSTFHGCTVALLPAYGIQVRDGIPFLMLIDQCHQGQWNALAMADPQPGTPAPTPLGVVPLRLGPGADPVLLAGPVIEQRHPFDAADAARLA